jgi:hypothetical protein
MGFNVWRHLYFQWLGRNKNDTPHNLDVSSSMICESQEGKLSSGDLKALEQHHRICDSACIEILDWVQLALRAHRMPGSVVYCFCCAVSRSVLPRERFSRVLGMFSSLEVKVLYPT